MCQNYAKYFDNDVSTFGNDSDYFMGTIKHLVTISNYSTTKKQFITVLTEDNVTFDIWQ